MTQAWASAKFRLSAKIGDVEFTDIIQFAASFELNTIPSASIVVATGRNIDNNLPASIHGKLRAALVPKAKAQVWLEVTPVGSENLDYDLVKRGKQKYQIWDGSVSGSGWSRTMDEASYVIHLSHWLSSLNNSSAISATTHPHSPHDLVHAAVYAGGTIAEGQGGAGPAWVPMIGDGGELDAAALEEDLWLKILKPVLDRASKEERIDFNTIGGGNVAQGNDAATLALARMPNTSKYAVPLAMDLRGADGGTIGDSFRNAMTAEMQSNWIHTTLWGKLIGEWAPNYFFSVCPRVLDALVVPFTGSLTTEFKTIKEADYTHFKWMTQNTQLLQAVGIFHSCHMQGGTDGLVSGDQNPSFTQIAGWFPGDDVAKDKRGVVLLKEAPRWLQDLSRSAVFATDTTDAELADGTGHAAAPGTGAAPAAPAEHRDKIQSVYPLLNAYAQHWYALETLKGRTAEISGRLRFDIAPGSTIRLEGRGAKFVAQDLTAVPLYASVVSTAIFLNSESRRAGTSFTIAHVRTEEENKDDKLAIAKPPLYKQAWKGAAMLEEF